MTDPWNLQANLSMLHSYGGTWTTLSAACAQAAEGFANASERALAEWDGTSADQFDSKRGQLHSGLDDSAALAHESANILDQIASTVSSAQSELDASWTRVSSVPHVRFGIGVTFFPTNSNESTVVTTEQAQASVIRSALDTDLAGHISALTSLAERWNAIDSDWKSTAEGKPFVTPETGNASAVGLLDLGDTVVVSGTSGDDEVTVSIDPATGDQIVTVNGVAYRVPAGKELVIRGGRGDDTITVPSNTDLRFTLIGGDGDDRITGGGGKDRVFGSAGDDEIWAGDGADYVSGGAGQDYIDGQDGNDVLIGGAGDDTLYGLDGEDRISGGSGVDYLEGGEGNDLLDGGVGNDNLSGGKGDDTIEGGAGDDVLYGGRGKDSASGGLGDDTLYDDGAATGNVEHHVTVEIEDLTSWITIEGSEDFQKRVEADLEMLANSPAGRSLLESMKQHAEEHDRWWNPFDDADTLTIREYQQASPDDYNSTAYPGENGDRIVAYQPYFDDFRGAPPVTILFHELVHVDTFMGGHVDWDPYQGDDTVDHGIMNAERQAVGLPWDHDHNPNTPEQVDPRQPHQRTENGLRDELGRPRREHYR